MSTSTEFGNTPNSNIKEAALQAWKDGRKLLQGQILGNANMLNIETINSIVKGDNPDIRDTKLHDLHEGQSALLNTLKALHTIKLIADHGLRAEGITTGSLQNLLNYEASSNHIPTDVSDVIKEFVAAHKNQLATSQLSSGGISRSSQT